MGGSPSPFLHPQIFDLSNKSFFWSRYVCAGCYLILHCSPDHTIELHSYSSPVVARRFSWKDLALSQWQRAIQCRNAVSTGFDILMQNRESPKELSISYRFHWIFISGVAIVNQKATRLHLWLYTLQPALSWIYLFFNIINYHFILHAMFLWLFLICLSY